VTVVLCPAALGVRRNVRRFGVSRALGSLQKGSGHRAAASEAAARCGKQGVPRSRWSLLMGMAVPLNKPTAYSRLVGVTRGAECHQGVRPSRAARLYGRRRAPVVSGRPSACHGCAVACIGQPPPPSAPAPVLGWWAWLLSRGCGGRAFARADGEAVGPKFSRAAARSAGHSVLNLAGLLISFPNHQCMALLCPDPLHCRHSPAA